VAFRVVLRIIVLVSYVTFYPDPNECDVMGVAGLLRAELVQAAVDRGSLEQELAASKLSIERVERDGRQEASKLQAEVVALRQRLDRADADLMHSRRENLRLTEQVSSLEREV
jgi:serologically defined colon cancer antigen 8